MDRILSRRLGEGAGRVECRLALLDQGRSRGMSIEGPGIAVNDAVPFDDALGVIPHPVVPLFRVRSTMVPIARPGALAYDYADPLGFRALGEADVFHLRAFGSDGLRGLSPLKFAR
ncbi:phage portal protein [Methylobacterium sp. E-065]|uniref:phage portal protein n=1 Tax=Methylobacterium sp. E-065 TaxID=2836583 RepID=UPI001FB9692B|nr:phage portal protein [Methylobacterium sp. E-065]MCJ2021245.1 phage portal protein [Methylobacterium sp. E-065]